MKLTAYYINGCISTDDQVYSSLQDFFEKTLKENKTPFVKIGQIKSDKIVIEDNGKTVIDQKISNLRDIWKNTIWNIMG